MSTPDRRTVQCPLCGQWDGHRIGCTLVTPDPTERVAEAMYAELDEHGYEDDDEKRGQVAHHFAQAAIDALLPDGFVGFIVQGEDKIKRRIYTDADAEAWADYD